MLNFTNYLTEQEESTGKEAKQTHLPHSTEHALHGHEGVGLTDSTLRSLHNYLIGGRRGTPQRVEKKIDGAPAFHIGRDNDGRIFVATKSLFNKNPKINYTEEDIQRNHGHAPGLVSALTQVLNHGHKILPTDMKPGEMYKGDFLFGGEGKPLQEEGEHLSAQPNLLKYKWAKDSPEAQRAANSKVGVAIHTFFNKKGEAQPISEKQRAKFVDHPDVFNYDPTVSINPQNYTPEEQRAFEGHMENARKSYSRIKPEVYDRLAGHGDSMTAFINSRVRNGQEGSGKVEEYLDFLNNKAKKDIDSVKTQASKDAKSKKHAALMQQIVSNSKDAQNILDMHGHFQNAKHVLLGVMNKNSSEAVELPNGEPTGHEGYVVTGKGGEQSKIVDQRPPTPENPSGGFAFNNLTGGGIIGQQIAASRKQQVQESLGATTSSKHYPIHSAFRRSVHIEPRAGSKQIPVRSSVAASRSQHQQYAAITKNKIRVREEIEITEAKVKKKVLSFIRANPMHEGHGEVIRTGAAEAQRQGADHEIILSHSQDSKKNPLSPAQKLKHARRAFPGVNFSVSSPSQPSLLHHLAKAHADGYKEVTIVGGSDRDAMGQMAQRYNGVKGAHGFYNVKLNFVQAGASRDEGGSGVASYSASKMRDSAAKNDFDSFKSMAPKTMKEPHVRDMFNDTRSGMKITESVSFKGFVEFLQEEDLDETYTSAVRGLGYVTGEPATPQNDVQQYFNNNAEQVNQINDSLSKQIMDNELSGAKAFNPKEVKNGRVSFKYWDHDDNGNPFMIDLARKRLR